MYSTCKSSSTKTTELRLRLYIGTEFQDTEPKQRLQSRYNYYMQTVRLEY